MRREQVEWLYERYGAALAAYGSSLLANRTAAEDLVQQVFLKLLRYGSAAPENPRAYLYRAVRNEALNSRRATRRETELEPERPWFGGLGVSLEQSLTLQASLLVLPEEQREVIVMHIWGEMTFEAIAGIIGVPANTAASRYRYGLSKLRERLNAHEVNEDAANTTKT